MSLLWKAGSRSRPPPPTCSTKGTLARLSTSQKGSRSGWVGARLLGPGHRAVEDAPKGLDALAPQPVPLARVDELVEEVAQLHDMAVGVEDGARSRVGHRSPSLLW